MILPCLDWVFLKSFEIKNIILMDYLDFHFQKNTFINWKYGICFIFHQTELVTNLSSQKFQTQKHRLKSKVYTHISAESFFEQILHHLNLMLFFFIKYERKSNQIKELKNPKYS